MPIRRRLALALLLPLAVVAVGCSDDDGSASDGSSPSGGDVLTIYSGRDEELVAPLIEDFSEATGIEVEVRYGNSAEMAAALFEEGDSTPAEVFYSQEVGAVGALDKAELLAPLPQEVIDQVAPRFQPKDSSDWVGVTGRSRVIVYDPATIEDEVPDSVLDLTDPAYEGEVAWAPENAGFQAFITAFRVTQGEDAARQWLEDMQDNGAQTYSNNVEILEAVDSGEVTAGLINHYYWAQKVAEEGADQVNAELSFPAGDDPGALVNATAAAIMKGAADNPDALAFIEYLLSEEGQTYFTTEVFEYPLVDGVADPEGVPPLEDLEGPDLDLTDLDSLEETQALLTDVGLLS